MADAHRQGPRGVTRDAMTPPIPVDAGGARRSSWVTLLVLALVFAISYSQYPLYYHTQNQYFFQGLAKAGLGLLRNDWFARTPDPWPLFTAMVEFTYFHAGLWIFYVYFILLLGIYALSLLGIASTVFRIDSSRTKFLVFLAIVTAMHSPVFGYASRLLLGLPLAESSPHHFNVGRILFLEGVGEKRLLGDMLNPGTFGVFLLVSIYLFLRRRPFLGVTSAVLAALFQPSYALHAGILTLSYMFIMLRRRESLGKTFGLGVYAFALISPLLVYTGIFFRPSDPVTWRESQDILVRLAYYPPLIPELWLGATAYLKMIIVAGALYVIRRTDLFWIMLLSFVTATGLSIIQIFTRSNTLALIIPWRISAYLVPLSTVILVAYALSEVLDRPDRPLPISASALATASVVVLLVLGVFGVVETKWRFDGADNVKGLAVMRHVETTKSPGQVYLIPPGWRTFRLLSGAPAFAERSVIPYDDVGVMEWYKRVRLADAFYGTAEEDTDYRSLRQKRSEEGSLPVPPPRILNVPPLDVRCRMLTELSASYGVTDVVLEAGDLEGCSGWKLAFTDGPYKLYAAAP
jgi:hypothetical protein